MSSGRLEDFKPYKPYTQVNNQEFGKAHDIGVVHPDHSPLAPDLVESRDHSPFAPDLVESRDHLPHGEHSQLGPSNAAQVYLWAQILEKSKN